MTDGIAYPMTQSAVPSPGFIAIRRGSVIDPQPQEPAPSSAYGPYERQGPGGTINAVHRDAVRDGIRYVGELTGAGRRSSGTPLASRFCSLMINTMNLRSSVSIIKFDCSLLHANRRLFGHKPGSTPKLDKRPILLRFLFRASHRQAGIDNRERSDLRETCWFTNSLLPVQRCFHPGPTPSWLDRRARILVVLVRRKRRGEIK